MQTDQAFIEEYLPFVRSIVHRVRARFDVRLEVEDLVSEGITGLLEARGRFDESRGIQFNTFAYYRVQGAVIDGIRKNSYISRRAYAQLRALETSMNLGEEAGETLAGSRPDAVQAGAILADSLARLTAGFVLSSIGQDEEESPSAEDLMLEGEFNEEVASALAELPERERALLRGFYFEGRNFDDVAEELGISKSWASRLHAKALDRLRGRLGELNSK